ncbi:hypothetical protein L6R52_30185 [Myxococcota bacterium]|nr:hypothetical protein [Myxococcota bacterium]
MRGVFVAAVKGLGPAGVVMCAGALAALGAGCAEQTAPLDEETSLYALVETIDGTSFHPPLGPAVVATGPFDATLLEQLQVVLETTDGAGRTRAIATFDRASAVPLRLFANFETYFVNVPAAAYFTDPGLSYRFRALLAGRELGFSDLSSHVFTVMQKNPGLLVGVKLRIEARPAPVVAALAPDRIEAGSGDTLVTITGAHFARDSVVELEGRPVAATRVSDAMFTVALSAADLATPQTLSFAVRTPAPGGGLSASLALAVEDPPSDGVTCRRILEAGQSRGDGVYRIDVDGRGPLAPVDTWCDMTNGGWTLLAKTIAAGLTTDEQTTIRRGTWATYSETGYGSPAAASRIFWMPLVAWHALTTDSPQNRLRVVDDGGDQLLVNLSIGDAAAHHVIDWTGCGRNYPLSHNLNCLQSDAADGLGRVRSRAFTTWDADHDTWPDNCAFQNVGYNGGFWYSNCYQLSMLHATGNLYSWTVNPGGGPVSPIVTRSIHLWFREAGTTTELVGTGRTPETAGRSCRTIFEAGHARGDGLYWIDPDNLGTGAEPFQAYCLMTGNGGGWTLVGKTVASGLTTGSGSLIRQSLWKTYSATGYGLPEATSGFYWMPLTAWNSLTTLHPTNAWWVRDDSNDLVHNNLTIGTAAQSHVINWSSCGAQWLVWRDGTVCLSTGTGNIRGRMFTTPDADNDTWGSNCAYQNTPGYNGGFWYSNCYQTSMLHGSGNLYSWSRNPGSNPLATSRLELWLR